MSKSSLVLLLLLCEGCRGVFDWKRLGIWTIYQILAFSFTGTELNPRKYLCLSA